MISGGDPGFSSGLRYDPLVSSGGTVREMLGSICRSLVLTPIDEVNEGSYVLYNSGTRAGEILGTSPVIPRFH